VKKKSPPYAIILALIFGVVAIYGFLQWKKAEDQKAIDAADRVRQQMQQAVDDAKSKQVTVQETPTNLRNVLYATQPMAAGVRVSSAFYEKKLTPRDILPDAYTDQNDIVGWFATRKIEKGDPLTPRNIGKSLPFLEERITPGMRAMAVKIFNSEANDTGGFVVDGDRVDLLFSRYSVDNAFIIDTRLVMQNLNVLYVPGPTIKTEKTDGVTPVGPTSIVFEVTPEQAQALEFMQHIKNGHFSMILKSRRDLAEIKTKAFTTAGYNGDLSKVQTRVVDKSTQRVKELEQEIEAQEKAQGTQGTTNETTPPTPPSP